MPEKTLASDEVPPSAGSLLKLGNEPSELSKRLPNDEPRPKIFATGLFVASSPLTSSRAALKMEAIIEPLPAVRPALKLPSVGGVNSVFSGGAPVPWFRGPGVWLSPGRGTFVPSVMRHCGSPPIMLAWVSVMPKEVLIEVLLLSGVVKRMIRLALAVVSGVPYVETVERV